MHNRPNCGRTTVVFGLQFGDEGKGQVVDRLAPEHDFVVRFNGGSNAGHTVLVGDERFALHQVPSGALTTRCRNVMANGVVVDPGGLLDEIFGLEERGVSLDQRLFLSNRAHLICPWHRLEDRLRDDLAALDLGSELSTGTTGAGIGPCYAAKAGRDTAVRVADLYRPRWIAARVRHACAVEDARLGVLSELLGHDYRPFDPSAVLSELRRFAEVVEPFVIDTSDLLTQALESGSSILFEGANSTLLDPDHGTFPYVTSSSGTPLGIPGGAGLPLFRPDRVIGVMKAYGSRVGNGPFPTEIAGEPAEQLRSAGEEFGTTTNRPRRVGHLDLVLARDAARRTGVTSIALTGLGVLAGTGTVKLATAWRIGDRVVERPPACAEDLFAAEPVLQEIPGWPEEVESCRRYEDLPPTARGFVDEVSSRIAPVEYVAVGRERSQLLSRGGASPARERARSGRPSTRP